MRNILDFTLPYQQIRMKKKPGPVNTDQFVAVLFQVYADASLVFPLLVAETFARNFKINS